MEATISRGRVHDSKQKADSPPIVTGVAPTKSKFASLLQAPFAAKAKRILQGFPRVQLRGKKWIGMLPDKAPAALETDRESFAQAAIADIWEVGNLADLLFHWKKGKGADLFFEVETTRYAIRFYDYDNCQAFLSDLERQWEEWAHAGHG